MGGTRSGDSRLCWSRCGRDVGKMLHNGRADDHVADADPLDELGRDPLAAGGDPAAGVLAEASLGRYVSPLLEVPYAHVSLHAASPGVGVRLVGRLPPPRRPTLSLIVKHDARGVKGQVPSSVWRTVVSP